MIGEHAASEPAVMGPGCRIEINEKSGPFTVGE
jgi:hypothetical protein